MRNQPPANRPRQTGSPDRFSAYLKRRLDSHRLPVDDGCWEAIEKELNRQAAPVPAPRRKRLLGSFAAVAAIALLLLLLTPFRPYRPDAERIAGLPPVETTPSPVEETTGGFPSVSPASPVENAPRKTDEPDEKTRENEPVAIKTQSPSTHGTGESETNATGKKDTETGKTATGRTSADKTGAGRTATSETTTDQIGGKATGVKESATPQPETNQPETTLNRAEQIGTKGTKTDRIQRNKEKTKATDTGETGTIAAQSAENLLADKEKPSEKKRPVTGPEPPASANLQARNGHSPRDEAEKKKDASPDDPLSATNRETLYASVHPKRPRHSWQIAATVGTGNSVSFPGNADVMNAGPSQDPSQNPEPGTPGITLPPLVDPEPSFRPEDFADASYSLPLTFGITVRKEINRWLGVESGLVYTYLSTRYARSGTGSYEGRLTLHYLGIPLQAVAQIWQNRRWSAYIAAGGTIEKGLQAAYRMESSGRSGAAFTSYSERKHIAGVQFSLNGAVGFAYRFHGGWSLYAEPRLSYYLDNDQPPSIRTDKPVVVGLGAGLRYAF